MNTSNPTSLKLGAVGTFAGRRYRVAGRLVMGMEEEDEIYLWNEFHLVDLEGKSATLVYEETDDGNQWRLFTLFDPAQPLTAEEAAAKDVGDRFDVNGESFVVTLVDESCVYHIEGQAPEGVEVDDVARYFNAESEDEMVVVSWTGEEVEFYRGLDLPPSAVAAAFGLPRETCGNSAPLKSTAADSQSWVVKLVLALLALAIVFAMYSSYTRSRQPTGLVKPRTPPAPLSVGSTGTLNGVTCRIVGHAVVEMAEVGRIYDRHEYDLLAPNGSHALLIFGYQPERRDWTLLIPIQPNTPMRPPQAAARRVGDKVELDGVLAPVTRLFLSTVRGTQNIGPTNLTAGTVWYGFNADLEKHRFFARWNDTSITFYHGTTLDAPTVTGAFREPEAK